MGLTAKQTEQRKESVNLNIKQQKLPSLSKREKTDFKTNEPHVTKTHHILNMWDRNKRFNMGNTGFLE